MKFFVQTVIFSLCVNFLVASNTYRAASVLDSSAVSPSTYASLIHEAGKSNADILVLPAPELSGIDDNYDETIKTLSQAARESNLYVVAHIYEKTRCQSKVELIRSNLVFDREGAIVSVYQKPLNNIANCTASDSELVTFETDFGVSFGLLMEEDIVLQDMEHLKKLKNYVMTGGMASEIPFFSGDQLSPSWAYVTNSNLVSTRGIFTGKTGSKTHDRLVIADVSKNGGLESKSVPPVVNPTKLDRYPSEDLSQYIIRPLEVAAGTDGYQETVCHGSFCCDFDIKISVSGVQGAVSYGVAAFDGARRYSGGRLVGTHSCALFACAGLYKRSCDLRSENNSTNITFEKISITANFSQHNSIQYPIIQSTDALPSNGFKFVSRTDSRKQVTIKINNAKNLITFGIFGRDFQSDLVVEQRNSTDDMTDEIYDYLYNEDVQEFFDYVWIRLRIVIFVVSIYILEML